VYEATIESYCGAYSLYATPTVALVGKASSIKSLADLEYDIYKTSSIMGNVFETHAVLNAGSTIFTWFKSKVVSKVDKLIKIWDKAVNKATEFTNYATAKPTTLNIQAYDDVSTKFDNNNISGINDDIVAYEDYTNVDADNSLKDATIKYQEVNEADTLEVTKIISYDENDQKVEEVPNYDKDGNIVSLTVKTNFTSNDSYDEENIDTTDISRVQLNYTINGIVFRFDYGESDPEYSTTATYDLSTKEFSFKFSGPEDNATLEMRIFMTTEDSGGDKSTPGTFLSIDQYWIPCDDPQINVQVATSDYVISGSFLMCLYNNYGDEIAELIGNFTIPKNAIFVKENTLLTGETLADGDF